MMPVTVALARFVEENFPYLSWDPYWYLGAPLKYLGGPVLPFLLAGLHRILPQLTLFEIYFFLTAFFWLLGGVAFYFLVKVLSRRGPTSFLAALIFLFGPFLPFIFPFADGTRLISFSFLPLIFLFYLRILKNWTKRKALVLAFLIALAILIDNLILPAILLGMLSLFLAVASWGRVEREGKGAILILSLALFLATVWHGPAYWFHLWFVPSFAGKGLGSVIILLTRLLTVVIPAFLAAFSLKRFRRQKDLLFNFAFFWTFVFGFLTLMRFLSDPDFWQDWTSYALELQLGGSILLAILVDRFLHSPQLSIALRSIFLSGVVIALALPWIFSPYKFLGIRSNIEGTAEYRIGKWLSENIKPEERVYLSGTTAFWLNSFFDVAQVRGGIDQGAIHPFWAKASWEIREGKNAELALAWLEALGVSYLVVHGPDSEEYYHDFKYPEKFKTGKDLRGVFAQRGDVIYRVEKGNSARVVNLKTFQALEPPKAEDWQVILDYANQLGRPLEVKWRNTDTILIKGEIQEGEGISLAVTYGPRWKGEVTHQRSKVRIEKDALGNLLLIPRQNGSVEIQLYQN